MNRRRHLLALAAAAIIGATPVPVLSATVLPATGMAAPRAGTTAMPVLSVVPKPVSATSGSGRFTLTSAARIVAAGAAVAVADDLAGYLRPATGYPLPVTGGAGRAGDVVMKIDRPAAIGGHHAEGYRLTVTRSRVLLEAATAHGLYNGVQTLRQLLPAWIESPTVMRGPWTMPAVTITDWPRYQYRGLMFDVARHFEPVPAVERLIGEAAAYKINVLHLHISDDQGFRLAINGFPRLTGIGGAGAVGTSGRQSDPGGFWTQADYRALVADAAAHFMTVVPEVDSPGHDNAIIMSEYSDPALPSPHSINCGQDNPPRWDYTEDVGYSAMCRSAPDTWAVMTAIIGQLSAITPGPYYDLGGDEVPVTLMKPSVYAAFVNKESGIVRRQRKIVMGWADIAGPGVHPPAGSVAEFWQPASGDGPDSVTGRQAVAKGMKIVMAPADHTYLDQKYVVTNTSSVPRSLGMNWACPSGCDVSDAYNWNPGSLVTGVTDKNVIGVEGALFSETIVSMAHADYMIFPRLPALAEVAWSPSVPRTPSSAAYRDFLRRLGAQGARWQFAGTNFYPSAQVPWPLVVTGSTVHADPAGAVSGPVAVLSAPGFPTSTLTMCDGGLGIGCTISWGDGSSTTGDVSGVNATDTSVNSLYSISGQHTYRHRGTYHGTVAISVGNLPTVTATFTAVF